MAFYWVCSSCNTKQAIDKWIDRCKHCGKQWNGNMKDIVTHGTAFPGIKKNDTNKTKSKKTKKK